MNRSPYTWFCLPALLFFSLPCFATTPRFYINIEGAFESQGTNDTVSVHTSAELLDRMVKIPRQNAEWLTVEEEKAWAVASYAFITARSTMRLRQDSGTSGTINMVPAFFTVKTADDLGQPKAKLLTNAQVEIGFRLKTNKNARMSPSPESIHWIWKAYPSDYAKPEEDPTTAPRVFKEVILSLASDGERQENLHVFRPINRSYQKAQPSDLQNSLPYPEHHPRRIILSIFSLPVMGVWIVALVLVRKKHPGILVGTILIGFVVNLFCARLLHESAAQRAYIKAISKAEIYTPVMEHLLAQTYDTFNFQTDKKILENLTHIDAPFKAEVFKEFNQQLLRNQATGNRTRIHRIKLIDCKLDDVYAQRNNRFGFEVDCRWEVEGYVGHASHLHKRVFEQHGRFKISGDRNYYAYTWRIVSGELLEKKQLLDEAEWKPTS